MGSKATLSIISSVFPLDGDYKIRWSPTATFDEDEVLVLAEGTVPRGGYIVSATFTIPEARYGINYVQFMRLARDEPVNVQFNVSPNLEVTPSPATTGSVVTIRGVGFPAEDDATLSFDGEPVDVDITTDEVGSFDLEFTVPDIIAGEHKFIADAPKMYTATATARLKVIPSISLKPELPEVGAKVIVSGCGFAANSEVKIKFNDISVANSPSTDETGCFVYEFKVPETSKKEHEVTVKDEAGNVAVYALPLEGKAPSKPMAVAPRDQRFGWFGAKTVSFSWTEVADPSGVTYIIEIARDLNFFPIAPGMRKTDLTQASCAFDIESGTYYWRVRAIDGAGNEGEWSISPYAFKVGLFSIWIIVIGGIVFLLLLLLLIRVFFRRLSEYYH